MSGAMLLRPALRTPPGSDQPLLFPRVVFRPFWLMEFRLSPEVGLWVVEIAVDIWSKYYMFSSTWNLSVGFGVGVQD